MVNKRIKITSNIPGTDNLKLTIARKFYDDCGLIVRKRNGVIIFNSDDPDYYRNTVAERLLCYRILREYNHSLSIVLYHVYCPVCFKCSINESSASPTYFKKTNTDECNCDVKIKSKELLKCYRESYSGARISARIQNRYIRPGEHGDDISEEYREHIVKLENILKDN